MRTRIILQWATATAMATLVFLPTATAHPGSWQASGTATHGGLSFDVVLVWGGSDLVLEGDGAGFRGLGDGFYTLSGDGIDAPRRSFVAVEDTRGQLFTSAAWCPGNLLQKVPAYSLQGPSVDLRGTYEFCWDTFVERIVLDGVIDGFTVHLEK